MSEPTRLATLPRLVATDLDGTLVRPDGSVSPRSADALARVTAVGSTVVLVTGRPIRWLVRVYPYLAEPYPAVCANGAVVYEPATDKVIVERAIVADDLVRACEQLRAEIPSAVFAAETDAGRRMLHEQAYPLLDVADDPMITTATVAEMAAVPIVKLLLRANGFDPDALTAIVRDIVGPRLEATHSSRSGLVELSATGVTKATGLAVFAEHLGLVASDVLVFGDMPNDLPMFEWAGHGVAVANAHPSVLSAATEVTGPNTDDGVAAYLESLLPA